MGRYHVSCGVVRGLRASVRVSGGVVAGGGWVEPFCNCKIGFWGDWTIFFKKVVWRG